MKTLTRMSAAFFILCLLASQAPGAEESTKIYTLSECVSTAIENSYRLPTYDSRITQNKAKVKETMDAFNPTMTFQGSYTYQEPAIPFEIQGLPFAFPAASPIVPSFYQQYNLAVSKLITSFGKVEAAARLQSLSSEQYKLQKSAEREAVVFNTINTYYMVLFNQELVKIAQADESDWKEQYKLTGAQYKRGTVARYDLLRVEVALAQSHDQVISTSKNLEVSKRNLRTLMGLPAETRIDRIEKTSVWESFEKDHMDRPLDMWKDICDKCHPALLLGRLAMTQGWFSLEVARLDNAPALSASSTYSRLTPTAFGENWAWKNSLALNIPIFDGGVRTEKMDQAWELIRQAQLNLDDTKRNTLWNVEKAYLDLHDLPPRLETAKKQVESAQESYRVAQVRYKAGLNTMVEVVDAHRALIVSETNQMQLLFSYYTQMAALSYATGVLFDELFLEGRTRE
ncbi:MAG: TolC family protein [Candidatus Eremiobacteraeota bacterium]|nr:TolC family protein [Candidatus Eremiobacteraeota bacterium]